MSTVNVEIGPVTVTNADGSKMMSFAGVSYFNLPREVFPVMEADLLAVFQKWNQYDHAAQAKKVK